MVRVFVLVDLSTYLTITYIRDRGHHIVFTTSFGPLVGKKTKLTKVCPAHTFTHVLLRHQLIRRFVSVRF